MTIVTRGSQGVHAGVAVRLRQASDSCGITFRAWLLARLWVIWEPGICVLRMDACSGQHKSLPFRDRRGFNLRVHLINPSDTAFGTAVITPRWLFVLAAATPEEFGDPILCDETLEPLDVNTVAAGDIVGIGIHTGNALRGMRLGVC